MDDSLRKYMVSRFAAEEMKQKTSDNFSGFGDGQIEAMVEECISDAEMKGDEELADFIAGSDMQIAPFFSDLSTIKVVMHTFSTSDLTTTFWVRDLPLRITMRSLADVVEFARDSKNQPEAPEVFDQIERLKHLPKTLSLWGIAVTPSLKQRMERIRDVREKCVEKGITLDWSTYVAGSAYIEDGNRRTIARLLNSEKPSEIEIPTLHWNKCF
jgi:hypothetical protein